MSLDVNPHCLGVPWLTPLLRLLSHRHLASLLTSLSTASLELSLKLHPTWQNASPSPVIWGQGQCRCKQKDGQGSWFTWLKQPFFFQCLTHPFIPKQIPQRSRNFLAMLPWMESRLCCLATIVTVSAIYWPINAVLPHDVFALVSCLGMSVHPTLWVLHLITRFEWKPLEGAGHIVCF